ncbi:MAG: glucose-6-phosphate isomerase [Breznakia sp.]
MLTFDTKHAFSNEDMYAYQQQVTMLHEALMSKTGKGNDFLGWIDWIQNYDKDEFQKIKESATYIRENCDVFLVCGIGGSYLGARAMIEAINGLYADKKPEIIFCGNTFSSTYTKQILRYIEDKDVCLNVISKSGTTTETALAFRIFKQAIEKKYGKEASKNRILATTDKARGTLFELASKEGYEKFTISDDIGGRYSVITAVGLLPIAVAGIDIDEFMGGVAKAFEDFKNPDLATNTAYQYAVSRNILKKQGNTAEMFVTYDLQTAMLAEWWKQLFGESEGKNGKGILPTSATFSTDLHSVGQFIQDGAKILFETLVLFKKPAEDICFPSDIDNLDNMNYLADKNLDWVNKMAMQGTLQAHEESGNVANLIIEVEDFSPKSFGYLVYFFFRACAMSVYLIDENPFDQPGVEVYKKNMFALLGKK